MNLVQRELLERELESASIAGAVKQVAERDGSALMIEGPAGIGKSLLLGQARAAAHAAGLRVLSARGSELERQFAFGAVRQLFEPLLASADGAAREALLSGPAGQASDVFTRFDAPAALLGDFAVLHGLFWLTANTSENTPLVLIVDDLQWCDAPSLRYLLYLLPRLEGLGVLVVAGVRSGETDVEEHLLLQIAADPITTVLRPHALTEAATGVLLDHALTPEVDPVFAAACHRASGGNPLLLRELARTITAERMQPNAFNAARILDLGPQAVDRLVSIRTARLSADTIDLAKAVAVLGERADMSMVAALAGQEVAQSVTGVADLERMEILRTDEETAQGSLGFVHPLVRAAVYGSISAVDRIRAHRTAARLLMAAGAGPEQVAAHLLHVPPPSDDPDVIVMLRAAADEAARRGSPGIACTYLRRCLDEHLPDDERLEVLIQAGQWALLVDTPAAAELFGRIHAILLADPAADVSQRAQIAVQYASVLLYCGRIDECEQLLTDSIALLPDSEQDLQRRLQAWLVVIAFNLAGHDQTRQYVEGLHQLPPDDSLGGRMLDSALSIQETLQSRSKSQAVMRAIRGLGGECLSGAPMFNFGGNFTNCASWTLTLAESEDIELIDERMVDIHRRGDLNALGGVYMIRGQIWLRRGQLTEAEVDLRAGLRGLDLTNAQLARDLMGPWFAESLMEQGRLEEASAELDKIIPLDGAPLTQIIPYALNARAQFFYLQGQHERALQSALNCKDQCAELQLRNPAAIPWRVWTALALHALNRTAEAREIATEDLQMARQWGAPRALGMALRINGLLQSDPSERLNLLHQATSVLEHSNARLEYAKSLADLGAAIRRTGRRTEARGPLRRALELATSCGATPLAEHIRTELLATGARPRRDAQTGLESLTPSELRIANLAAQRHTNRQIAQALFVTPKTVEVHLGSVYRKLGITTRNDLADTLQIPSAGAPISR